jgi:hypothetical protein
MLQTAMRLTYDADLAADMVEVERQETMFEKSSSREAAR